MHPAFAFQTLTVAIPSAAMHKSLDATIVLPEAYLHGDAGARFPVVYLLHGSGGHDTDWTANTHIGRLADRYRMILVMPDGGRESWHIDSPFDPQSRYETYVGKEVVSYVDAHYRTNATKAARAITGLSMGGFGALNIAVGILEERDSLSGVVLRDVVQASRRGDREP